MGTAINSEVFTFEFGALPKDRPHFYVERFEGTEALNTLFEFNIELLCDYGHIDTKALIGTKGTFVIRRTEGEDAVFPGYISKMVQKDGKNGYYSYSVVLSPSFAKYKLIVDSSIFLDKNLKETIEIIMGKEKFFSVEHEFRFADTYPKKQFALQFEESAYDYILWRLEEQGAYFYFDKTGERVIFTDKTVFHEKSAGKVYYSPGTGLEINVQDEIVDSFELKQDMLPERVVVRTYNWLNPNEPLVGIAEVSKKGRGDVYLADESADSKGEAERIAGIRAEQIVAGSRVYLGSSLVPFFRPGVVFTLAKHETFKFNRDYIITKIKHEGRQGTLLNLVCRIPIDFGDTNLFYRNSFECIESDTKYRSPRTYKRKSVYGAIHGFIAGDSAGNALIDKYGRYKVVFAFDVSGRTEGNTSCWIRRAQEQVGKDFGVAFPLTAGTEVLVTFIDGNPDLPIISGALANGETGSISGAGNADFEGVRTDGGAQLVMSNKKSLMELSNLTGSSIMFSSGSQDYMTTNTHIGLQSGAVGGSSIAGAAADSITGFISRAYAECGNWFLYLMGALAVVAKTGQSAYEGLSEKNADPNVTTSDWGGTITKLIPFIRSVMDFVPYNAALTASKKNASSTLQCFPGTGELILNFIVMIAGRAGSVVADIKDYQQGQGYESYAKDSAKSHKIVGQIVNCLPELAIILLMLGWRRALSKKKIGGVLIDAKDKNLNLHARSYIGIHAQRGILLNAGGPNEKVKNGKGDIDWGSPRPYNAVKDFDPAIKEFVTKICEEPSWFKATIEEELKPGHTNLQKDPGTGLFVKMGLDKKLGSPAEEPAMEDSSNSFIIGKTNLYYLNCNRSYNTDVTPVYKFGQDEDSNQMWQSCAETHKLKTTDENTYLNITNDSILLNAQTSIAVTVKKENEGAGGNSTVPLSTICLSENNFEFGRFAERPNAEGTKNKLSGLRVNKERVRLAFENTESDSSSKLVLLEEKAKISIGKDEKQASLSLTKDTAELKAELIYIAGIKVDDKQIEAENGVFKIGKQVKITTSNSTKEKIKIKFEQLSKKWIKSEEQRLNQEKSQLDTLESQLRQEQQKRADSRREGVDKGNNATFNKKYTNYLVRKLKFEKDQKVLEEQKEILNG